MPLKVLRSCLLFPSVLSFKLCFFSRSCIIGSLLLKIERSILKYEYLDIYLVYYNFCNLISIYVSRWNGCIYQAYLKTIWIIMDYFSFAFSFLEREELLGLCWWNVRVFFLLPQRHYCLGERDICCLSCVTCMSETKMWIPYYGPFWKVFLFFTILGFLRYR